MPKVISANRLADGIVVYAGRDGSWSEQLSKAKVFANKAEAEAGLLIAQNDAKRNLVVEPVVVEVTEEAGGLRAVTLREIIRARGPTIDFLPRTWAFAHVADPPRIPRPADTRVHEFGAHVFGCGRLFEGARAMKQPSMSVAMRFEMLGVSRAVRPGGA
jgi:Protein of unknown function (DUF2849)